MENKKDSKFSKKEIIAVKVGFIVSEEGVAYNKKGDVIGYTDVRGYSRFSFKHDDQTINIRVHRLQAYQKYGNLLFKEELLVRHLDGDPGNNCWDNIALGTMSDNMMDIPEQIRIKRAVHASSFATGKWDRDKIRAFHSTSKSYSQTMAKFGISSKGTLSYILNKKVAS